MRKIVLCPNPGRDKKLELTKKVYRFLKENGVSPVVCPLFERYADISPVGRMKVSTLEKEFENAEMLITFGGDGTILHAARAAAPHMVPILGINMGKKGFMAELEEDDVHLIKNAVDGNYSIDRRVMLDVTVERNGESIHSDFALNDVVVGGIARLIDISVYGDGRKISTFSGDGIVIATPTGSTAYSMSAGGPIVEPAAENIIVTPICPHVLIAKSYVLAPERHVTVEIGALGAKSAYMTADGGASVELESGDKINIRRSRYETRLVRLTDRSFYEKVSEKLGDKR